LGLEHYLVKLSLFYYSGLSKK